ncbi:MAG: hypothetical protein M3354_09935 [Chloroflexota bacterium]|nr:hypothetical protein [Chloroflexota bacterium]
MTDQQQHSPALRRRVGIEVAAWGVLTALSTAVVGPLLLARDAAPLAFGIYNSGVNLFGLGAGWLGPRLATRLGSVAAATVGALFVARTIFASLPFLLLGSTDGAVPLIVAILIIWAAGEGIVLPLWNAFIAGIASPAERGSWLAWRATIAARAAASPSCHCSRWRPSSRATAR